MNSKPTYAYSVTPDKPNMAQLLRSTAEVDGWEEIGLVDRSVVQLIVTSLNYAPENSHRYCDAAMDDMRQAFDDVFSLLSAAMKSVENNGKSEDASLIQMYKSLTEYYSSRGK